MRTGTRAWVSLAALLGVLALLAWPVPRTMLDWQPALALSQPWRAWTAASVHYSMLHLGANLLGTLLVAALGATAQLPARSAWAWLLAWPLAQFGLLLKPELLHYGGLSGVLHAGVCVVALQLLLRGNRAQRWIGGAILAGVLAKLVGEAPWGEALRRDTGWDIAVAPFAHASGAVAGLLCAIAADAWERLRVAARRRDRIPR